MKLTTGTRFTAPAKNRGEAGVSLRALGLLFLTAGLVACGGGGGGGAPASPSAPTAPVAISQANAQGVTGVGLQGSLGIAAAGSYSDVVGVQTSSATPRNRLLTRLTTVVAQKLAAQTSTPGSVAGVVTPNDCAVSGSYSVNDFDGTTAKTATFMNCEEITGETINGSLAGTNLVSNSTPMVIDESGTISLNLTIAVTGGPTAAITGGYSFSLSGVLPDTTVTLTGSNLTMTVGARVDVLSDFSFSEAYANATGIYTSTSNFTISSTALGGSVTVATTTPFQSKATSYYPHTGATHITSSAGPASLDVTVLGDETLAGNQVQIDIDLDGASPKTYEATLSTTWAVLDP
jgi:hypothetical protein